MLHSPSAGKQLSLKAADSGIGVACEYEVKLTAACKSCFYPGVEESGHLTDNDWKADHERTL